MLGSIRTPLPTFDRFARSPGESALPHLRTPISINRGGLIGTCNPCLGFQGSNLFTLGRHKKWTDNRSTRTWVQSPIGPAVALNEGADSVVLASADNDDYQLNSAYASLDFTLSCVVRIQASATGKGWLFMSDRLVSGNLQGMNVWVQESDGSVHVACGNGGLTATEYYTGANAVTLGVWHHIIASWSDYRAESWGVFDSTPVVIVDGKAHTGLTWNGEMIDHTNSATAATNIGRGAGSSKMDLADWALWNVGLGRWELEGLIADPVGYLRRRRSQIAIKGSNLGVLMANYRRRRSA